MLRSIKRYLLDSGRHLVARTSTTRRISRMQLLTSCCPGVLISLYHVSFNSTSSGSVAPCSFSEGASCSLVVPSTKWRKVFTVRKSECHRVHAQPREGVDNETLNVTDLRDVSGSSESPSPAPENSWTGDFPGGLSEEEAREALLFEQGGVDEAGPSVEEAKKTAGMYERTIHIPLNRGQGAVLADIFMIFGGLLDRPFGTGASIAATGSAVVERVFEEIEKLKAEDRVNEQLLFEVIRVTRLLEMDLKLVSAAQKDATLLERLEQAKEHCRQAVVLANAL